eukprot:Polyplicarium_translucidae@DN2989_c1_g1_i1.p2
MLLSTIAVRHTSHVIELIKALLDGIATEQRIVVLTASHATGITPSAADAAPSELLSEEGWSLPLPPPTTARKAVASMWGDAADTQLHAEVLCPIPDGSPREEGEGPRFLTRVTVERSPRQAPHRCVWLVQSAAGLSDIRGSYR